MIFYRNQDLRRFRAPWIMRLHPALAALLIWLAFAAFQTFEWWLR